MDIFHVNVIVGERDHHGNMSEYGGVCYRFDSWEAASNFIKLSLENDLIVECRVPNGADE